MTLNREKLIEYLKIVVDMEKNLFLLDQSQTRLRDENSALQKPKDFPDPVMPEAPSAPKTNSAALIVFTGVLAPFMGGLIPMVIAALFLWTFGLVFLIPLVIVIPAALFIWVGIKSNKDKEKSYRAAQHAYQQRRREYEQQLQKNQQARLNDQKERNNKMLLIGAELKRLGQLRKETRERLDKIYAKDVIFPKYRNLVMVCSLYEYLCAGRCDALEGHEGAYNILEMEIRLDHIIVQLDRVISMLGTIQNNQYVLYSAIQESNQKSAEILQSTQSMVSSLGKLNNLAQLQAAEMSQQIAALQKNSALTAYHTERVQKELAYMNRMDYLTGRNDGVPYNHPPV